MLDNIVEQVGPRAEIMVTTRGLPTWWEEEGALLEFYEYVFTSVLSDYPNLKITVQGLNEPDTGGFFEVGDHDPVRAASILNGLPSLVRSIRPGTKVIAPCTTVSATGLPFQRAFMDTGLWVGENQWDALSVNPYDDPNDPEHLLTHLSSWGTLAAEYDLPIWATEYTSHAFKINGGATQTYPTLMDDEEGASRVARATALFNIAGFERLYWYLHDLHIETVNGAYSCIRGVGEDGTLYPPMVALGYQIELINNWRTLTQSTSLWSIDFKAKDGRYGTMLWRPAGQTGTIDTTGYSLVNDMYGNNVTLSATYNLANQPIYAFD
jgi:hypothetical protein